MARNPLADVVSLTNGAIACPHDAVFEGGEGSSPRVAAAMNGDEEDPDEEITRVGSEQTEREPAGEPCLVVIYGEDLGRRYPLGQMPVELGRGEGNDVRVPSTMASRHHARLVDANGELWIEDLDSTNGTLVNNEWIGCKSLSSGDIINVGSVLFKYIRGSDAEAHYHEEIYRMTITDNLTGLPNRRYLVDFLERELARAHRHNRPLSFAVFDVDQFKRINDAHGHLAGDQVLGELAQVVEAMIRREELVARFGGEEFAVVMPETNLDGGREFAERIRQCVANTVFHYDGHELGVTVSVGVTALDSADQPTVETVMARADDALYRAKESGRDCVVPSRT